MQSNDGIIVRSTIIILLLFTFSIIQISNNSLHSVRRQLTELSKLSESSSFQLLPPSSSLLSSSSSSKKTTTTSSSSSASSSNSLISNDKNNSTIHTKTQVKNNDNEGITSVYMDNRTDTRIKKVFQQFLSFYQDSLKHQQRQLEEGTTIDTTITASCQFQQNHHHNQQQQQQKQVVVADGRPICCTPWDISMDDWWLHQPDWEVSYENDTMTCFSPITNKKHANYMRYIYSIQYGDKCNCSNVKYIPMISSGYGASIGSVAKGLRTSIQNFQSPFKITKHWINASWVYSYNYETKTSTCSTKDIFCYFLNITKCTSPTVNKVPNFNPINFPNYDNWIIQYVSRQRQWVRRQVYEYIQIEFGKRYDRYKYLSHDIQINGISNNNNNNTTTTTKSSLINKNNITTTNRDITTTNNNNNHHHHHHDNNNIISSSPWEISTPCTVFHVRRTDVVTEPRTPRRYFHLSEYINVSNTKVGDTIVLLTDDQSTIDEAKYLYPNYNWLYVNRTRYKGFYKFEEHFPSGNHIQETITILAELNVASKCNTIVRTQSGYATFLSSYMTSSYQIAPNDPNFHSFQVDVGKYWNESGVTRAQKQQWATKFLTDLYEEIDHVKEKKEKNSTDSLM